MPVTGLPIVSRQTSLMAVADLLRGELDNPEDTKGCLINAVVEILAENPGIVAAVDVMMSDEPNDQHNSALIGMVLTYRALKAQAEVDSLERLTAA